MKKKPKTKDGHTEVKYKGKWYPLPIKPQGGIYEGFTPLPIKKKPEPDYSPKIEYDNKGNIRTVSMTCPPPTRRDILRYTVTLELTRKDAQLLKMKLEADYNNITEGDVKFCHRILNKLKREGVK